MERRDVMLNHGLIVTQVSEERRRASNSLAKVGETEG